MDMRCMTRTYAAGVTVMMLGPANRAWVWLSVWLAWVPCSRSVGLVSRLLARTDRSVGHDFIGAVGDHLDCPVRRPGRGASRRCCPVGGPLAHGLQACSLNTRR